MEKLEPRLCREPAGGAQGRQRTLAPQGTQVGRGAGAPLELGAQSLKSRGSNQIPLPWGAAWAPRPVCPPRRCTWGS